MNITLSSTLEIFESNPDKIFTFDDLCIEGVISSKKDKIKLGGLLEKLADLNVIRITTMMTQSDTCPVPIFKFIGNNKTEQPKKKERSIADFAKSLEELKANLAENRDKLRDYISEANAFADDIDEEIDLLDQCADLMSRYV